MGTKYVLENMAAFGVPFSCPLGSCNCSTTNELKEKSIVSAQSNLEPSDELCPRAIGKYGDLGTVAL